MGVGGGERGVRGRVVGGVRLRMDWMGRLLRSAAMVKGAPGRIIEDAGEAGIRSLCRRELVGGQKMV
jgi:hypothetical protein